MRAYHLRSSPCEAARQEIAHARPQSAGRANAASCGRSSAGNSLQTGEGVVAAPPSMWSQWSGGPWQHAYLCRQLLLAAGPTMMVPQSAIRGLLTTLLFARHLEPTTA
mmetsp:Transcript_46269/g.93364  ORF Transcript_46269/g.93364 Transcript_46269/m.93364 type:complete len:108 (-) Transcript_46269:18-341(-)